MIPRDYITEWRQNAPWTEDAQVEQDLVICRALVEMFNHDDIYPNLAFRGGTALFKLYLDPVRYSEDIDLVQVKEGPIGPVMDGVRDVLNPWLGNPTYRQTVGAVLGNLEAYREAWESMGVSNVKEIGILWVDHDSYEKL